jgi:hypothetical protein
MTTEQPAPSGMDALLTEAKAYLGGSFPLTPVHVQMARLVDALEAQVELRTRDQADLAEARAEAAAARRVIRSCLLSIERTVPDDGRGVVLLPTCRVCFGSRRLRRNR